MKTQLILSAMVCLFLNVRAGETEKTVKTKPEKVIVYKNGAQIFRQAQTTLVAGENKITFDWLEEGVSTNSIQVGGNGSFIITESEYIDKMPDLDKLKNTADFKYVKLIKQIKDSLALIDYKTEEINYRKEILNTEKTVLLNYRLFKGEAKKDSLSFLKDGLNYLQEKLTIIYNDLHLLKKEGDQLSLIKQNLQNRLNGVNADLGEQDISSIYKTNHQITVSIISDVVTQASINVNYFVNTAGWEPMYDLRTEGVESQVKLTYKGVIYQHTNTDWSNVKLVLSTGTPQCNLSAPELYSWYLDVIKPVHQYDYEKSKKAYMAAPSTQALANTGATTTTEKNDEYREEQEQAKEAYNYVTTNDQQVQATFEIKLPYTIASDNKKHTVSVLQKDLDTKYIYKTVPKVDVTAYLLACVTGWEDLNLLPGKASVFYAGTYVGQTYINPATTNDTLNLTLGKDDNVVVKRVKQKDKSKEKLLNDDKVYSFAYEITMKNGNTKNIEIEVKDQLPITHGKDVVITKDNIANASYEEATGILTWRQTIKAKDTKHINFAYTIKAPKDLPIAVK
ncbi:MAG TPA: DUF4139 domain-containing protein [Bacteroidia bacterium]|nr:DUF4139 domain-containing protein [Bacteroidia bacterium]